MGNAVGLESLGHHSEGEVRPYYLSFFGSNTCFDFSTLLKSDQWHRKSHHVEQGVRGAVNWRNVTGTNIYALGQPTVSTR